MKAYIFDLDGTLLDSTGLWAQIDEKFLGSRGIAVPADYARATASLNFREAALYTIGRFGLSDSADELLAEWHEMAEYAYAHTIGMKPRARRYLAGLRRRGARLGIATSASPALAALPLVNHGIYGWFDTVCTTDEVGRGKDHPDIYLYTAEKLGASPSSCVVFEDVLQAVVSAKAAGMTVYGVYDHASAGQWDEICRAADGAIRDFSEAPGYFD